MAHFLPSESHDSQDDATVTSFLTEFTELLGQHFQKVRLVEGSTGGKNDDVSSVSGAY